MKERQHSSVFVRFNWSWHYSQPRLSSKVTLCLWSALYLFYSVQGFSYKSFMTVSWPVLCDIKHFLMKAQSQFATPGKPAHTQQMWKTLGSSHERLEQQLFGNMSRLWALLSLMCNDTMLTWHSPNTVAPALFLVHVFPVHRAFYYL